MKTAKKIGIWMDHSNAHLMEFAKGQIETKVVHSDFSFQDKQHSLNKSEHLMHNREQQEQGVYYKKLGERIKNFDEVLLFGPTEAKVELFNVLRADSHFENIKIEVKQSDNITENQQHAFVKEHFSKD